MSKDREEYQRWLVEKTAQALVKFATVDLSQLGPRVECVDGDEITFDNPEVPEGKTVVKLPKGTLSRIVFSCNCESGKA